jgi:hypothetical protein
VISETAPPAPPALVKDGEKATRDNAEKAAVILDMSQARASAMPQPRWPDGPGSAPVPGGRQPAATKPLHTHARVCRRSARAWAAILGCLSFAAACKTPLVARQDAGRSADAGRPDATADSPPEALSPDLAVADLAPERAAGDLPPADGAPDRPTEDLPAPDLAPPARVPQAFRFVNHTSRVAYVDGNTSVVCHRDTPAGWEYCNFFNLGCPFPCTSIPSNGDCRVQCEQPEPALVPIAPGASYVVPWKGRTYAMTTGACTAGQCQQETVVQSASFEASALVFADFACGPLACQSTPDGLIRYANPLGGSVTVTARFSVPSDRDEVVLDITSLPLPDAGPAPDLASVDLATASDRPADAALPGFPEIPGHTFAIAADATSPDASAPYGSDCRPQDADAHYELRFSPDGTKVSIVRTDPVQEQVLTGVLSAQFVARLVYRIDNAFAGGELAIWRDHDVLIAQLALFGSGVPVVWCIESPMTVVG